MPDSDSRDLPIRASDGPGTPSSVIPDGEAVRAPVVTTHQARRHSMLREVIETAILALLIFVLVRTFVLNFQVDGNSMLPSFHNGEMLLVNRNAYGALDAWDLVDWIPGVVEHNSLTIVEFGEPERGDVIVFTPPAPGGAQPYIKRVIGIPGDEVEVHRNNVIVNGVALDEGYVDSENRCDRTWEYCGDTVITVPEGTVFVMGDNRSNSQDSRYFGPVPNENIIGRAWVVYWPSDAWGPVPEQQYTGPVS